ncbi:MAG: glycosyltransferase family 4 protein [Myxococcota bacterium]
MASARRGRMAVVVRYFPKLSETFIAQEIRLLEERGLAIDVFAMPRDHQEPVQPVARSLRAPIRYFPAPGAGRAELARANLRAFARQPLRYLRTWLRAGLEHRKRRGRKRLRRFYQAGWLAAGPPGGGPPAHLHTHFLYEPSEIGRYAAAIAGVPHTIEAHAKDIYLAKPKLVAELVNDADALLTCTGFGAAYIRDLPGVDPDKVHVVYHGVDTEAFQPASGTREPGPLRLVSVGRLVAKKGYDDVLEALSMLRTRGVEFVYEIYGDGRLRDALEERIRKLALEERVFLRGPVTHDVVMGALRGSDVFVCGSRPTEDGDRDGIPNSLAEAMACGLPAVATDVSGIPELVEDGRSGRVVPPGDPAALAEALLAIAGDPSAAARLGRQARERVLSVFDCRRCIDDCADVLRALSPGLFTGTDPGA